MSLEEIKKEITSLNDNEKQEVALFLEQLKTEEGRDAKLGEFLHGRLAQVEGGDFSNKTVTDVWTKFVQWFDGENLTSSICRRKRFA
jgi:hypothetical protein